MKNLTMITPDQIQDIIHTLSHQLLVPENMILPFAEFDECLHELLKASDNSGSTVRVAGHIAPDIAIAVDRAGLHADEVLGVSPFAGDADALLRSSLSPHDILYIANPNRVTGACFSLTDLELLAQAVPMGTLIVDEYYHDFYGITALPLFEMYSNVVILRSLTAAFGIGSADSGFMVASKERIDHLGELLSKPIVTTTQMRVLQTALDNAPTLAHRLGTLHDESLRLASALTTLGIQCRLSATDFLLLRVGDPTNVGNSLARASVPIENLHGYPQLDHYLRYRLQSPFSNDRLIDAFTRMPAENYRLATPDRRPMTFRHRADESHIRERSSVTATRARVVIEKNELV